MTSAPLVSVVVPTLNEVGNVALLCERVDAALAGASYEITIVDDGSTDGTVSLCRNLERLYPLTTRVRSRCVAGLSGAVLHGFSASRGEILVVMDADLQHPPESIPAIISPLTRDVADFVIGSRHVEGAAVAERWGMGRRLTSSIAALLVRPLAGPIRDPMSGFFALRRSAFLAAANINPIGFKLGIELICKCGFERIVEVPIEFGLRLHGQSKLNWAEKLRYGRHLARLYLDTSRLRHA
jgi:dolichol-phosphate mannosyltransferase